MRKQKILWGRSAEGVGGPSGSTRFSPQTSRGVAPPVGRSTASPTHGFAARASHKPPLLTQTANFASRTLPPPSAGNPGYHGGRGLVPGSARGIRQAVEGRAGITPVGDGGWGARPTET